MNKGKNDGVNFRFNKLKDEIEKYKVEFNIISTTGYFDELRNELHKLSVEDATSYINNKLFDISVEEAKLKHSGKSLSYFERDKKKLLKKLLKYLPSNEEFKRPNLNEVLKDMFPNAIGNQLELLQSNLKGESKYVKLYFVGKKISLWYKLGKVYACGIERQKILRVFSECVEWKKNHSAEAKQLKSDEISRKLQGKEVK